MSDIRALEPSDADAVAALWLAAGLVSSTDGRAAEIVAKLQRDPDLFLVAVDDAGAVIGSVMGAYDGHRGYVKRMAVGPEHRRRGVARLLMHELERRFVAIGVPRVHLHVLEDNRSGRGLWETLGYARDAEVLFYGKDLGALPVDDGRC